MFNLGINSNVVLNWDNKDFKSTKHQLSFVAEEGFGRLYSNDSVLMTTINNLRLLVNDTLPMDYKHHINMVVTEQETNVWGKRLPTVLIEELHEHRQEWRYSLGDDVGDNFKVKVKFSLHMSNAQSLTYQSLEFKSREQVMLDNDALLEPIARGVLHSVFTIFPSDATYAITYHGVGVFIVAKYKDFTALLSVWND